VGINKTEKDLLYVVRDISNEFLVKQVSGLKSILTLFDNLLIKRMFIKLPGDEQAE